MAAQRMNPIEAAEDAPARRSCVVATLPRPEPSPFPRCTVAVVDHAVDPSQARRRRRSPGMRLRARRNPAHDGRLADRDCRDSPERIGRRGSSPRQPISVQVS